MSKNNIWHFSILALATFSIILYPTVLGYALWAITFVCILISISGRNLEKRFNLMFFVMIITIVIGLYISIEHPYKRNVHEKIYVPNSYVYLNNKLYIDTKSPKTMVCLNNLISGNQLAYMNVHKCRPIRIENTFDYWIFSKTTIVKWRCAKKNDN